MEPRLRLGIVVIIMIVAVLMFFAGAATVHSLPYLYGRNVEGEFTKEQAIEVLEEMKATHEHYVGNPAVSRVYQEFHSDLVESYEKLIRYVERR